MSIASLAKIDRKSSDGLFESTLVREGCEELFLTATPRGQETVRELLLRVLRDVQQRGTQVTAMTVFNGRAGREVALASLLKMFGAITWPINWLESESSPSDKPAGVEIHAIKGPQVHPIRLHGRHVGNAWEDATARHCELGDLRDETTAHTAPEQAQQVLEDMTTALGTAGMTFANVYRTWFRNRNILGWYREFNRVRTDYFTRAKVFDGLLPASTGISATNSYGAALLAGLWAMEPKNPGVRAFAVDSPMQDSARKYGSSFSRAVEVDMGDHRRLTISGTASIDPAGKTAYVDDVVAQVDLTMQVVRALLKSRGMDWADVTRGLVYFRQPEDMAGYEFWRRTNGVKAMPVIVTNHTVCRDDLLYEIEVDAVSSNLSIP